MRDNQLIQRIAIAGGGTAGWMAASMLARALPGTGAILEGIGMTADSYDPLMDVVTMAQCREILGTIAHSTAQAAAGAPSHDGCFAGGMHDG